MPLNDDERARLRFSDGSPTMLRGETLESIVESIVAVREAKAWDNALAHASSKINGGGTVARSWVAGFLTDLEVDNPYREGAEDAH